MGKEMICGKSDRCVHGGNCPLECRPMVSYLCFESRNNRAVFSRIKLANYKNLRCDLKVAR